MAVVNYFLKLDGIQGESRDAKHKGEIELESFSWGETSSVGRTGTGGGAGKTDFGDLHVAMKVSKASPLLLLSGASGQHLKQAVLTARKAGKAQLEFLVIKLTDVIVSSYSVGGLSNRTIFADDSCLVTDNYAVLLAGYLGLLAVALLLDGYAQAGRGPIRPIGTLRRLSLWGRVQRSRWWCRATVWPGSAFNSSATRFFLPVAPAPGRRAC